MTQDKALTEQRVINAARRKERIERTLAILTEPHRACDLGRRLGMTRHGAAGLVRKLVAAGAVVFHHRNGQERHYVRAEMAHKLGELKT